MVETSSKLIAESVSKISKAKFIEEIDTETFSKQMWKVVDFAEEYSQRMIPEPELSQIPRAFVRGEPATAFIVLIEFRSGRSLRDLNRTGRPSKRPVDMEQKSAFALVYCNFLGSFMAFMNRNEDVKQVFLVGGCVPAALSELDSLQFAQHRDESPAESLTARAISSHLTLLYNVSIRPAMRAELFQDLHRYEYFPILKRYPLSRYMNVNLNDLKDLHYFEHSLNKN